MALRRVLLLSAGTAAFDLGTGAQRQAPASSSPDWLGDAAPQYLQRQWLVVGTILYNRGVLLGVSFFITPHRPWAASSQGAEHGFRRVAGCCGSAELRQSPLGSGSGVSRALVGQAHIQIVAKLGWPEGQQGPFLGCLHPGLLTGVTTCKGGPRPRFTPLCSWNIRGLPGPLRALAVFKALFSRAVLPATSPPAPRTCSLPDARGHGVGRGTVQPSILRNLLMNQLTAPGTKGLHELWGLWASH